jgi:hypothetical protein
MCDTNCDRTFDSSSNIWRVTPLVEELSTTSISSFCFNNNNNNNNCNKPEIEIKNLGIVKVDPEAYSKEYGTTTMKPTLQMLNLTRNIKQVDRVKLASDQDAKYFMGLVGDVHALCMIDLEKEGLGAYKKFLEENSITCPVDSRNLNNFKNKTEIIKLELAGQELQTLDIYKERLNEYKQAIKPNEQKNDTEIIEKKDDNKMLPIVSVQKVANNTELIAAPAQTVTPKLLNTTLQQQLMNTTLTPIIPSITPVAPITPKMQTTITPLVPIQTPRPLTNMNTNNNNNNNNNNMNTFIQTNLNNNATNPSTTTTNNNNNNSNTNAFKLNNQYNQIQINNLVNLLQFNYLKNSIAKNFSNSKLINSNFQVHTLKRPPPIHANTFILNRSFF